MFSHGISQSNLNDWTFEILKYLICVSNEMQSIIKLTSSGAAICDHKPG